MFTGYLKTPTATLFNTAETYRITLMVQHVLVLAIIVLASLIMFVVVPKMNVLASKPGEKLSGAFLKAQKQLPRLSVTETILGMLVLLCVVLLKA